MKLIDFVENYCIINFWGGGGRYHATFFAERIKAGISHIRILIYLQLAQNTANR